jgi:hypothetical protein
VPTISHMDTAAAYGHDDTDGDDPGWPDWIDDDEAVDRLLRDVVETLERDDGAPSARDERSHPAAGDGPAPDRESRRTR